jgi:hypothetical protein
MNFDLATSLLGHPVAFSIEMSRCPNFLCSVQGIPIKMTPYQSKLRYFYWNALYYRIITIFKHIGTICSTIICTRYVIVNLILSFLLEKKSAQNYFCVLPIPNTVCVCNVSLIILRVLGMTTVIYFVNVVLALWPWYLWYYSYIL